MDRQFKKQEAQWQKEEDARIKLMYDVYNARERDILNRQAEKKEEDARKIVLTKQIEEYEEELRKKRLQEYERNKSHQKVIVSQMENKKNTQKRELEE
eukprot:CAMPEP_0114596186 /NCGR_PEP_ID=MMETSP0125-20121206/18143_1 /TAXON_ID=485358 ORGANISM="Aristerostoma sp., Strain ATCC 50986" /NCGR_SAMPLE_ID=MMETSP0125 /ASSEMBLY_ACC=CAM_ASM_000245 /LENGTH=97 /DNA_ID=CAMNT_0001798839 /DNA_START=348 /DNA_END=641 /DNA_ORIENTATION=+